MTCNIPRLTGFAILAALLVVPAAGCASGAYASAGVVYTVPHAPPPARVQVRVARPGPGYVWVAGYWEWRPSVTRYVWVDGRWLRPPRGRRVWVRPRVKHRHGGWVYVAGHWR